MALAFIATLFKVLASIVKLNKALTRLSQTMHTTCQLQRLKIMSGTA